MKEIDANGYYNLYGIYCLSEKRIKDRLSNLGINGFNYTIFKKIIRTYLEIVFDKIINQNLGVLLPKKLGEIRIMKILCTKFNPKRHKIIRGKDGKISRKRETIDVNKTRGFFFSLFWLKQPKLFKNYRIELFKKHKVKIYNNVIKHGGDYLEHRI